MIQYRTMHPEDISGGLLLCRANQWNQLARDWELFLQCSPADCRVAIKENKIVGSVTTLRYQQSFSWIGMLLVDPSCQRQGIGMQLLLEAIDILKGEATVKLDATPAGREVYLKMDFKDEYPLSRMRANVRISNLNAGPARPMTQKDIGRISLFDTGIFGANRQAILEWTYAGSPQNAFLVEEGNELLGYCLGRQGYSFSQIGPVVAKDPAIARSLVSAALVHSTGHPVIIDIPHHDRQWAAWLASIGFSEQRSFTRMFRGSNAAPGIPELQFAILGPEFG